MICAIYDWRICELVRVCKSQQEAMIWIQAQPNKDDYVIARFGNQEEAIDWAAIHSNQDDSIVAKRRNDASSKVDSSTPLSFDEVVNI